MYGSELIVADRYYPSTRMCSNCKYINEKQSLANRIFVCKHCGMRKDRDHNAAINLQEYCTDWRIRFKFTNHNNHNNHNRINSSNIISNIISNKYPESTPGLASGEGVKPSHSISQKSLKSLKYLKSLKSVSGNLDETGSGLNA